jgi:hypothetical protein
MGKIKLKSNISKEAEEDNFPIAHVPTRTEVKRQQYKDQLFGDYSDIKPMLQRVGGTMIRQEEHLTSGDWQTYDKNEWTKMKERASSSFNSKNNTSYYWH